MSRQRARTSADMFLQEARPRAALRWSSFFCSTRWADLRRDVFHRRTGRTDFRPARQSSNHFKHRIIFCSHHFSGMKTGIVSFEQAVKHPCICY